MQKNERIILELFEEFYLRVEKNDGYIKNWKRINLMLK